MCQVCLTIVTISGPFVLITTCFSYVIRSQVKQARP